MNTENNNVISEKKDYFFSEKTGRLFAIGGLIFILVSTIFFTMFGNWSFSKSLNEEKIAQFGDFVGGVIGSLFSLAGVILFYVALKEQRKDIGINQGAFELQIDALNQQIQEFKEQKEELIETRKVSEEQTRLIREQTNLYIQQNKELKDQTSTAKLQQFDSSFFSCLNVFINLKNNLDDGTANKNYFGSLYEILSNVDVKNKCLIETLDLINRKYFEIFDLQKNKLSQYFKTIYRIIILIDTGNIEDAKKNEYIKLFRSQLTDDELLMLYYNYQTSLGLKVRPYVIKYNLLKHIRELDKIELKTDLVEAKKIEMENFLSLIESYVISSLEKFSNIEDGEDIEFSKPIKVLDIEAEIKISIKSDFEISIFFDNNTFDNHSILEKEKFKKMISRHLYSVLFLSKFKKPEETEVIESVIECLPKKEFKFKIDNIENI